jgi:hypothetical protein
MNRSDRRRFRHQIAGDKSNPNMADLMLATAKHFAELSVDARAIIVGPHLTRVDGGIGVYVVFTHPEATAHAAFAELVPPMPPGSLTERQASFVADQARTEFVRGLRRHFGEVREYKSSVTLADAAVAKWPCARTVAFRGEKDAVFAGNLVQFTEH